MEGPRLQGRLAMDGSSYLRFPVLDRQKDQSHYSLFCRVVSTFLMLGLGCVIAMTFSQSLQLTTGFISRASRTGGSIMRGMKGKTSFRDSLRSHKVDIARQAALHDAVESIVEEIQPQTYKELSHTTGPEAMKDIRTVILDQDGVLWRGNRVFPTTLPSLQKFRELGIRVLFVTNNAAKSRNQYVDKWKQVGLEITKDEIVPASFMAAAYLEDIGFEGKVFLIGDEGTRLELEEHGIEIVECEKEDVTMTNDDLANFKLDPEVKAVVLAHDPYFNYKKLAIATQYLRSNPECHFIVTNMDAGDALDNGRFMPGTGGMADAITTITGRVPVNTGKGGNFLLPFLMSKYNVQPSEMMCIGDRLDTDIALGRQANCKTAMPFTGVTSREQLHTTPPEEQPTYVMENLGVLLGLNL